MPTQDWLHKEARLLAVDPSLTCSGWALFHIASQTLTSVGKIKSLPASRSLPIRFKDLQEKIGHILNQLKLKNNDFLVCESQTTMRDPKAAFKVEQVRCIFETVAREYLIKVPGRINPRSIHREVMGLNGKQLPRTFIKETAIQVVQALFSNIFIKMNFPSEAKFLKKNQDIVDAILVGHLAVTRLNSGMRAGTPWNEVFEMHQKSNLRPKLKDIRGLSC